MIAVPLPFGRQHGRLPSWRCIRRTGDSLPKRPMPPLGIGLREVFAAGAAASFHQPEALFGRCLQGYLFPSQPCLYYNECRPRCQE